MYKEIQRKEIPIDSGGAVYDEKIQGIYKAKQSRLILEALYIMRRTTEIKDVQNFKRQRFDRPNANNVHKFIQNVLIHCIKLNQLKKSKTNTSTQISKHELIMIHHDKTGATLDQLLTVKERHSIYELE